MTGKAFFVAATAAATIFLFNQQAWASADNLTDIKEQITKQHDQSVKRLQEWIHQVSIAAENRGYPEGADYLIKLLQQAGFDQARQLPTEGKPGVFATLDAGAPKTVGIYFMYDVKQFDPAEWTSPPTDAALVDKSDFGKVVVGRGAVNQKGPESAFLAALHAVGAARKKVPVNLALVAEGEEEKASENENCKAKLRPRRAEEKAMVAKAAKRLSEAQAKKLLSVEHWVHDANWEKALELLMSRPTVNIEGLVGGYTGPGGKTILPHRAVAKLDLRLVPDMTAADSLAALKAHLAKRGFGDIEVNMTGGYDPTSTPADARLIKVQEAVYRRSQIDPIVLPRNAGSWPGYVFTGDPLRLPACHFGLGHGSGAHAPDEYYVIESTNPKIQGIDGAVRSYVEYLYEVAGAS